MKVTARRSRRAFTLVELVISLVVTMILLGSIATLVVMVIRQSERNEHDTAVVRDIALAHTAVYTWYDAFSGYELGVDGVERCVITVSDPEGNRAVTVTRGGETVGEMRFDAEADTLRTTGGSVVAALFTQIDDMRFDVYDDRVLKVSVWYDGKPTPLVYLLTPMEFS